MSAHEGVSCDACGKSNFRSKRHKCLICYDYDLCSTCYEQGEASSHHTNEHPMQCILTRQDFDLYYHGERCTSDQPQSLTCPFCGDLGFAFPLLNDSSSSDNNLDLFHHLQLKHADDQQSSEVICPICAAMANGEPNLVTADLISHIANDHQHQQMPTPSSAGSAGINPYSRQSSSNRDFDFGSGTNTRAGFRRGPLRTPSRRGSGLGRGGGTVSQHFVVDSSAVSGGNDPIADLLTQLSTVRRLAAANNNNSSLSSSSSSNTINLQTLTRQQYERERLRATGRSHHHHHQQQQQQQQQTSSSSNVLPSLENDIFDSLFTSALFIDPSSSSNNAHQTWAQIVAQQQQQQQPLPTSEQSQTSTTKTTVAEPDPSLLRKFCDESSSSSLTQQNNTVVQQQQKRKSDFVHSLLFASFGCPLNDNEK